MRARELGLDLGERDAARLAARPADDRADRRLSAISRSRSSVDGGERGLDRLLAELLGAMRHALVEQLARVGFVRRSPRRAHARALRDRASVKVGSCGAPISRIEPHRQSGLRHVLLGLAAPCTRRNGRSRRPAPRWRGRRGCLRPDDRALPTPPEAITGTGRRRRPRGSARCRSRSWCRRGPSR